MKLMKRHLFHVCRLAVAMTSFASLARSDLLTSNANLRDARLASFARSQDQPIVQLPPSDVDVDAGERIRWSGSEGAWWTRDAAAFGDNGYWRNLERSGFIVSAIRQNERVWVRFDFIDFPASAVTVYMNYGQGSYNGNFGSTVVRLTALDAKGNLLESHNILQTAPIVITRDYLDAGAVRGISRPRNEIASLVVESDGRFFAIDDLRIARFATGKLGNCSTRATVAANGSLIPGFVIVGEPAKVLIRAVGPGLAAFNVSGVMPDPQLTVFKGSAALASNDDWFANPERAALVSAATAVGAFALNDGSKDAAVLLTLLPGAYTVLASDTGNRGGEVLLEVYQVP